MGAAVGAKRIQVITNKTQEACKQVNALSFQHHARCNGAIRHLIETETNPAALKEEPVCFRQNSLTAEIREASQGYTYSLIVSNLEHFPTFGPGANP